MEQQVEKLNRLLINYCKKDLKKSSWKNQICNCKWSWRFCLFSFKIAQEEFPQLHVEYRSAIHIGRKFQDPLNELIKIDPKSIGIGQYQHDVNQKELSKQLTEKLNKVVNLVGVDLNTATKVILSYISS